MSQWCIIECQSLREVLERRPFTEDICLVFYQGDGKVRGKIAYGNNSDREAFSGCCYGTHAEMNAIEHLKKTAILGGNKKKCIKLSLIVIKVDSHGKLKESKPCAKCIMYMDNLNKLGAYCIKTVYYSNSDGDLTIKKFSELLNEKEKHVSYRFRSHKKRSE